MRRWMSATAEGEVFLALVLVYEKFLDSKQFNCLALQ